MLSTQRKDNCLDDGSWSKKAECHLVWPHLVGGVGGKVHIVGFKVFTALCMSTHGYETTIDIDLGCTNTF